MAEEPASPSPQTPDLFAVQSFTDELTGLANRAGFNRFLAGRDGAEPVGVVFADLDRFVYVNHEHGHLVGDQVLVEIGRRLAALAPADSIAGRWSGDQFALVLPDTDDISTIMAVAVALLRACDTPVLVGTIAFDQRLSVGVAIGTAGELHDALVAADIAMYEAKKRGRARAVCLDPAWEAS